MGLFSSAANYLSRSFGRASLPKKQPEPQGSALPDLSVWDQFQRIGGSLTPSQVSNIIRNADTGDCRSLIDLGNEMRQKDGHLHSVLSTREMALLGLKWELVFPGQDPKSKKGRRQRRFVEAALRGCHGFRRMIAHQTSAIFYGFAVSEILWLVVGGKMLPAKIICHAPRRFCFRREDGELCWRDSGMGDPVDFRAANPEKFIVSQPRVNGDVPCREGLLRVLMWPALFRNWTLSDWLKLAELAWKPWRIGRFDKATASTEDIAALKAIVAGMSSSGAAVHPKSVEIEMMLPTGTAGSSGKSDHAGLYSVMGGEMSKAVIGQTLTTEQGSVGSRALGTVHNDVRKDILESDAEWLAEVLTEQFITPLVRKNFGPTAPVPQLRFITTEAADVGTYAKAIVELSKVLRMPAQWVRDQLGIPEPKPDDELVQDWINVDLSGLDKPDPEPANDGGGEPQEDEEAA